MVGIKMGDSPNWSCVDGLSRASPVFSPENDAKLEPFVHMEASAVFRRRMPPFKLASSFAGNGFRRRHECAGRRKGTVRRENEGSEEESE